MVITFSSERHCDTCCTRYLIFTATQEVGDTIAPILWIRKQGLRRSADVLRVTRVANKETAIRTQVIGTVGMCLPFEKVAEADQSPQPVIMPHVDSNSGD